MLSLEGRKRRMEVGSTGSSGLRARAGDLGKSVEEISVGEGTGHREWIDSCRQAVS